MENQNAIVVNNAESILAEFAGGSTGTVDMMIGIGLVKDSQAVYFQYMGEGQPPQALMLPNNGKPLRNLYNVTLVNLQIEENVGEFNQTKLNIDLLTNGGKVMRLTSGLTTLWSQSALTCINGLYASYDLSSTINFSSYYGNSARRPAYASLSIGRTKVTDDDMYTALAEARADKDNERKETILRDIVSVVGAALNNSVEEAEITVDAPVEADSQELPF